MMQELEALMKEGKAGTPAHSEIQRRFGWEFNGMRLHELYFGNMTKASVSISKESPLRKNLEKIYGTFENWEKDFRAVGAMRGIGWTILCYDSESKEFFNVWVNEHDMGHLAGAVPLLVLDVFEHAYTLDYGLKRADYIEAFFKAIDWSIVEKRLNLYSFI
jgi:Fe-Mn family superoxide dismutase